MEQLSPDCIVLAFIQRVHRAVTVHVRRYTTDLRRMARNDCPLLWMFEVATRRGVEGTYKVCGRSNAPVRYLHVYFESEEGTEKQRVVNFMFGT